MRDLSKRCNFGLKLDDFKACQGAKVSAAGQHHDLVWKKLWNPTTKTGQTVAKLWVRTRKIRLTQHHQQTGSGHARNQGDALTNIGTSSALNTRGLITDVPQKPPTKNVKVALRPQVNKVVPIKSKSAAYDKNQEVNCWREHCSELYSVESHFDGTIQPPTLSRSTELESSIAEQLMAFQVAKHLVKMSYQCNSSS